MPEWWEDVDRQVERLFRAMLSSLPSALVVIILQYWASDYLVAWFDEWNKGLDYGGLTGRGWFDIQTEMKREVMRIAVRKIAESKYEVSHFQAKKDLDAQKNLYSGMLGQKLPRTLPSRLEQSDIIKSSENDCLSLIVENHPKLEIIPQYHQFDIHPSLYRECQNLSASYKHEPHETKSWFRYCKEIFKNFKFYKPRTLRLGFRITAEDREIKSLVRSQQPPSPSLSSKTAMIQPLGGHAAFGEDLLTWSKKMDEDPMAWVAISIPDIIALWDLPQLLELELKKPLTLWLEFKRKMQRRIRTESVYVGPSLQKPYFPAPEEEKKWLELQADMKSPYSLGVEVSNFLLGAKDDDNRNLRNGQYYCSVGFCRSLTPIVRAETKEISYFMKKMWTVSGLSGLLAYDFDGLGLLLLVVIAFELPLFGTNKFGIYLFKHGEYTLPEIYDFFSEVKPTPETLLRQTRSASEKEQIVLNGYELEIKAQMGNSSRETLTVQFFPPGTRKNQKRTGQEAPSPDKKFASTDTKSLSFGPGETEKVWDPVDVAAIDEKITKDVTKVVESLEEAFFFRGTPEAKYYATELTTTTGFLLTYKLLLEQRDGETLEKEMTRNNLGGHLATAFDIVTQARSKHSLYREASFKEEHLLALSLSTAPGCYQILNENLRAAGDSKNKSSQQKLFRYTMFISCVIQGLRILPAYWGEVYRGSSIDPTLFKKGATVLFQTFTSTSKDRDKAMYFLSHSSPSSLEKKTLFIIHSKSGKSLEDLSFFPKEKEVVFRPYTSFLVMRLEEKEDYLEIELKEAHPDTRGRKVLVWVDDDPRGNRPLMDAIGRFGVTCVHKGSTKEALELFASQPYLLKRGIDRLRLITDMVRLEDGKTNFDAGLNLVRALSDTYGYKERIFVYTGEGRLDEKRRKFAGLNVSVVHDSRTVEQFANFEKLQDLEV